jgi:hypothetical protein
MRDTIRFSTLNSDGKETNVREIKNDDIRACPFTILVQEHYRENGTCKCNNRAHRDYMIKNWEYTEQDFEKMGIEIVD